MSVLVTGSAGFIGSHLTERLLADRYDVIGVDDLRSSGPLDALKEDFGAAWDRMEFHRETVQSYCHRRTSSPLGAIWHLASPVGPAGVLDYAGDIAHEIIDDAYALASLAIQHKCRMVFVSTSEAYGGGQQGLCREDMDCRIQAKTSARLEYAAGKLAAEVMLRNTPDLDVVIVRLFNVAGPRQSGRGGFMTPRFVQQAMAGEPLTVFGAGSQVRAVTHVADVIDGLVLAMEKGRTGEVYNLGASANRTTIENLAQKVIEAVGEGTITHVDGKAIFGPDWVDAVDKFPDAGKATRELGWYPTRSVEQVVQDILAYERGKVKA